MEILSHRGYWRQPDEKNRMPAIQRSFACKFGVEFDVRDYNGELVVSHDIPGVPFLTLEKVLDQHNLHPNESTMAINIKADGLQIKLRELLMKYDVTNYFVFDMSVPDGLLYIREGFNVFTRQSEYEDQPSFYDFSAGIWMDEFDGHWIKEDVINRHLSNRKKICIVSPELHGRDCTEEWEHYKSIENNIGRGNLMICTDYPAKAMEYFND